MNFITENWFIILAALALAVTLGVSIYRFAKLPTAAQLAKVKAWLLWAVAQAETALGGGTGKLKLRYVYDLFLAKFPWLARVISFECFSALVDEALDELRELLQSNDAIKTYVGGGEA